MTVIVASLVWQIFVGEKIGHDAFDIAGKLAQSTLAPVTAPQLEQQRSIVKLSENLGLDIALFSASREPLGSWGKALPAPDSDRLESGWFREENARGGMILLPDGRWLVASTPDRKTRPFVALMLMLAAIAMVVSISAYPLVRRLTGRLERLQAGVERMGAGDFTTRVKVEGKDEVARLAGSFNIAAEKIEHLLAAHRQLLANASHEFRTPLSRLRLGLELYKGQNDHKRRAAMEEDIAELDALVDEILLTSRLNADSGLKDVETLDLLALAAEECARIEDYELTGTSAMVDGEARLLRRAIRNLLQNARLHGEPPIEIVIDQTSGHASLTVTDQGSGISPDDWDKVFAPFYRLPGTQSIKGSGLGLPLVRQIAENHRGTAEIVESRQGKHVVRMVLPVSPKHTN